MQQVLDQAGFSTEVFISIGRSGGVLRETFEVTLKFQPIINQQLGN